MAFLSSRMIFFCVYLVAERLFCISEKEMYSRILILNKAMVSSKLSGCDKIAQIVPRVPKNMIVRGGVGELIVVSPIVRWRYFFLIEVRHARCGYTWKKRSFRGSLATYWKIHQFKWNHKFPVRKRGSFIARVGAWIFLNISVNRRLVRRDIEIKKEKGKYWRQVLIKKKKKKSVFHRKRDAGECK